MVDQVEIHRMAQSEDVEERKEAAEQLRDKFADLPDKKKAWEDLIHLTHDKDVDVRWDAAHALRAAVFPHVLEREKAWEDLICLIWDEDLSIRVIVAYALGGAFPYAHDREEAWEYLHSLIQDKDNIVRMIAAIVLGVAFPHVPDKEKAWKILINFIEDEDGYVRARAADALGGAFPHVPDKDKAWENLIRIIQDHVAYVRARAADALGGAFPHVPDKEKAWEDLHCLAQDKDNSLRSIVADALGGAFPHVPDREKAWEDLHHLTQDNDESVRWSAACALGGLFPHVSDRKKVWEDLIHLTHDKNRVVYAYASHSLGRASIFKAAEAKSEESFRKELENALGFFENASKEVIYFNPASFCYPFYRSFYAITFKKQEAKMEVERYLIEAKCAVEGSESKEKLLEAVKNLSNALEEAQKAGDFDEMKSNLNAYRRYCDRACELLDTTEEKAPGASRLIRKGLPIIDERIKGIIGEIQEKAKALCKQVKDTEYKEIGQQVNNVGQDLSKVIDPIRLEKEVSHMLIPLSAMCKKMPEEDRGEACEILKQIIDEQNVEDKLPLISMFLSKISTQMEQKTVYVNIEKSKNVQVSIGKDNYQVQSSNSPHEKV